MSVDLSGLKVGGVWRVATNYDNGMLIVAGTDAVPSYTVHYDGHSGWDTYLANGFGIGGRHKIESILRELKPVSDITAADLDGRVIETADGGKVFFADGVARLWNSDNGGCLGTWRSVNRPDWASCQGTAEQDVAAYAAELERRRNPPIEVQWCDLHRINSQTIWATCKARGDVWSAALNEDDQFVVRKGGDYMWSLASIEITEQYIRDHYAKESK